VAAFLRDANPLAPVTVSAARSETLAAIFEETEAVYARLDEEEARRGDN
jgi:hypothetical protein